ncbi:GAF domain-containing protein [Sphingobacterium sp. DR205]|uniref:GAF domain-containing protein n=1 Tax=Sphingobacterium sp. DR205 TaxID=2713573 RepID=UPI0013E4C46B|nr:GAF domain-containing protein [Sphingobacterium sp. DR205]QIH34041.1 GAF domain-containing protein [Sphingobacterium sp. DR205]
MQFNFNFDSSPFKILIAFHKIIGSFEETALSEVDFQASYARSLLEEIKKYPMLTDGIEKKEDLRQYEPIIKVLLADLFPRSLTRNEIKAVTIPFYLYTFNHTERLDNILRDAGDHYDFNYRDLSPDTYYILNCCMIISQYYGIKVDAMDMPIFLDIPDKNNIMHHYRVLFNADFVDIIPTDRALELSSEDIIELIDNFSDIALWKSKFPEQSWIMKGFSLMTLFDATTENAVSSFKSNLLREDTPAQLEEIRDIFRSIYRIDDLRIGLTSFEKIKEDFNLRIVEKQLYSHLLYDSTIAECEEMLCNETLESMLKTQELLVVPDIDQLPTLDPKKEFFINKLKQQQVKSFIFAPLIQDDKVLGILEMSSSKVRALNSVNANKLNFILPFIKDKVSKAFSETENQIEAIIQREYTSIHPSVKWRFQEEAIHYLNDRAFGKDYTLQEIIFEHVYPLYGQIDVQGSSESRNQAIKQDLINQATDLIALFTAINQEHSLPLFEQKIFDLERNLETLDHTLTTDTEQVILDHFNLDVHPILDNFRKNNKNSDIAKAIDAYFERINLAIGGFYEARQDYDNSITLINKKLVTILDEKQVEAQEYFPHYYERYKTDGIEHNLYIGASIAPDKNFELYYLKNLRLWQLQVMCEMESQFRILQPQLPHQLEVTSLVLVFATPISIRFKMDEKQFDIDGSYNVRYEIAKKRIDKAKIKGSFERITQKGKLVIVYSHLHEETEYLGYINLLQHKGLLNDDIEKFEVEDLQGLIGLKAIRVGFRA